MKIEKKAEGTKLTVALEGRLDTNTAPELEKALSEDIAKAEEMILDLEKLEYISSAGLRVLLSTHKKMGDGKLIIRNVNELVMEVFEVTGFVDVLTIE